MPRRQWEAVGRGPQGTKFHHDPIPGEQRLLPVALSPAHVQSCEQAAANEGRQWELRGAELG